MDEVSYPSLSKYLATCGFCSRRAAVDIIKQSRVTVNGNIELNPGYKVTDSCKVLVDGILLGKPQKRHYIMLNKPRGYVCSNKDKHATKLAVDLIKLDPPARLFSAGRLDCDSEGLIIFSDDGDFVNKIAHPSFQVLKEYKVKVSKSFSPSDLKKMVDGVMDEGEKLHVLKVRPIAKNTYILTLNEGKKREIRRIVKNLGAETLQLKRISVGNLKLGSLKVGEFRELSREEIDLIFCDNNL
jgi:23S rRNA pseudouridine2605 synthase